MTTLTRILVLPLAMAIMAFGSFSSASAQTVAPRVAIQLATTGLTTPLVVGQTGTMARLILDTTGSTEAVRISALPFNLVLGNGATSTALENCRVYNEANANVPISTNATTTVTLMPGLNTIRLNDPIVLSPNTITTLALRCEIDASLVAGGTFTFSMNTTNVAATGVTSGLPAVVTVRGAVVPPPVAPVTPGLPNTGAGGDATRNAMILLGSAMIAALGIAYTRRVSREA